MIFRRPSLGWAKAKLPARAKPASAEIADRITAPPRVCARHSVHSSKDAIGASPAERSDASLSFHIGRSRAHENADPPHPFRLLRPCRERPRDRRAAERDQQLPPSDGDCHTPLPCEVRKGTIARHERAVLTARHLARARRAQSRTVNALAVFTPNDGSSPMGL